VGRRLEKEVVEMAYEFKYPFEPPWEDLRAQGVTETGARWYIFDSCVVTDPKELAAIDEQVGRILAMDQRKKALRALKQEG